MIIQDKLESIRKEGLAHTILSLGTFISVSRFENAHISIYRLDSDFYEVWTHPETGEIYCTEPLDNKVINPYLKHLSASSLN
ncbi:hypothetical protein AB9P05_03280 [Roseivirga sp. BDSF3-8]|uniref:hypothetical protein n=1 Tax=Roseivirga sp. BDSF3-8 TaxID=3241598 RepID=UPI0035319032